MKFENFPSTMVVRVMHDTLMAENQFANLKGGSMVQREDEEIMSLPRPTSNES